MSSVDIKKSESTPSTKVPSTIEVGQPRVITSSKFIKDAKKKELQVDNRLDTFDSMLLDSDVFTAANFSSLFAIKSIFKGSAISVSGKAESRLAAEFVNYCLHNLGYGTWWDAVNDMATALKYGWSDLNIVLEKREYGRFKGSYCIRKLSPRSQHSVYGWLWNDDFTEWQGLVQKPPLKQRGSQALQSRLDEGIHALANARYYDSKYPIIRSQNLIHTAYNTTLDNPQGDSPLMRCFDSWYEKKLLENYELAGISKDLNGLPVLRVPSELVEKANDPDTYPNEYEEYINLQQDMADLHQGRTTHIVLTSDTDVSSGKYLYNFELVGIQGGGKNYVTSDVINQKRKAIFNVFGAGHLLLGQDGGGGSYALSTSQTGSHGHLVERDIMQYANIINTQLIPRLLAANGVFLDYKHMPKFVPAEPDELSLDELSKAVQRIAAVKKLTPSMYKELLRLAGLPTEGIDDLDYTDKGESRAGDGMVSGMGSGTSSEVSEEDLSSSNMENKMLNIVTDRGTDRLIDVATGSCINEDELDSRGNYR